MQQPLDHDKSPDVQRLWAMDELLEDWVGENPVIKAAGIEDALNRANYLLEKGSTEKTAQADLAAYARSGSSPDPKWDVYTDLAEAPAPPWTIDGLLGKSCLGSGLPHAMKSFAWLAASLDACHSGKVWGHFAVAEELQPFAVRFVETEDSRAVIQRRIKGLLRGLGTDRLPNGFSFQRIGSHNLVKSFDEFRAGVLAPDKKGVTPKLVVISTLHNLIPGVDLKNPGGDLSVLNSFWTRLSDECPTVLLTHSPHSGEKRAIGSVMQQANFESSLHFTKGKDGRSIAITRDSKLTGIEKPFRLNVHVEAGEISRFVYTPPTKAEEVREYIAANPGVSAAEVANAIGCSKRTAERAITGEGQE